MAKNQGAGLIGTALVSNTTACEASRLLLEPVASWEWYEVTGAYADRAIDLMSLIDSVVLYERLFFLPASLPSDVSHLELRAELMNNGVLAPFPNSIDHKAVADALLGSLRAVKVYRGGFAGSPFDTEPPPFSFNEYNQDMAAWLKVFDERARAAGVPVIRETDSSNFEFDPYEYNKHEGYEDVESIGIGDARTFPEVAQKLVDRMTAGVTGTYAQTALRAMYYVFVAEQEKIPYWPSVNVQHIEEGFPNYFHRSARTRIYERLAKALRTTTETISREFEQRVVFIPPFSALVLARSSRPDQIPVEILSLREEYEDFRNEMIGLEQERMMARSIKDRDKIVRSLEHLCKEVARPFEKPARMSLETTLRYIPDVTGLAVNPSNPVGWTKLLLDKPVDWLISWYRRRPVAKLVCTAKNVANLQEYDTLLDKHFGPHIASSVRERATHMESE